MSGLDDLPDFTIQASVKNGRMLALMRRKGWTAAELARRASCRQGTVGLLLNLRKPPTRKNGEFSSYVVRIADALDVLPEDMFAEAHYAATGATNRFEVSGSEADVRALMDQMQPALSIEDVALAKENAAILAAAMRECLTPRQRFVLNEHFGITNTGDVTRHAIGATDEASHITEERVRQIEMKALQRLRQHMVAHRMPLNGSSPIADMSAA